MKCHRHPTADAAGVCVHCGRGLCAECLPAAADTRATCSAACATNLERESSALQQLVDRAAQTARASAVYCYLSALLSASASVAAWFMLPSPFLVAFAGGGAVVLAAAGYWHGRGIAR